MKRIYLLCILLLVFSTTAVSAFELDLDELFGGDLLQDLEESTEELSPAELVLVGKGIEVGGSYSLGTEFSRMKTPATLKTPFLPIEGESTANILDVRLTGDLFGDLRPDPKWRVFLKTKYAGTLNHSAVDMSFSTSGAPEVSERSSSDSFDLSLHEFFLDYTLLDRVYLRLGKQVIGWGYLFDPLGQVKSDGLNMDSPDTSSYFSQDSSSLWQGRPGVLALRLSYPIQSNNLYLHVVMDERDEDYQVVVVPKVDYVLGKTDFSAALAYRGDRPLQLMGSFSTSVGEVSIVGESVITLGHEEGISPWQSQIGAVYSHSDADGLFNFTSAVFHRYNEDHSLGITVGWNDILKSKFSATGTWIGTPSKDSGMLALSLQLPSLEFIKPEFGVNYIYGKQELDYSDIPFPIELDGTTRVYFAVTLGSGSF